MEEVKKLMSQNDCNSNEILKLKEALTFEREIRSQKEDEYDALSLDYDKLKQEIILLKKSLAEKEQDISDILREVES